MTTALLSRWNAASRVLVLLTAGAFALGGGSAVAASATGQSPILEKLVAAGELPPVAQRVGDNPLVVKPVDGVMNYGGTLRMLFTGASDVSWVQTFLGYDGLVRWDHKVENVEPDLAASWTVSDDARVYTFTLRKGVKWSDGQPFTSHDVAFWFAHAQFNKAVDPNYRPRFIDPADKLKVETPDDNTVRLSFERPKALLLYQLATPDGEALTNFPEHYLRQFHIDFNPDADKEAKAQGFQDWADRFNKKMNAWFNPEKPTLFPWRVVTPITDTQNFTLERNPYFWKVDPAGNQLPYIDKIDNQIVGDKEVMLLKALNGEVDYIGRYINTLPNKAVFVENQKRNNLEFFKIVDAAPSYVTLHLNETDRNPAVRAAFRDKQFRIALSYAINRQEIIDLIFAGQGEPYQIAPRPESEFYNEEMAKQYTKFDPDLANKMLDEAGYDKRDANGWRLTPDGKELSFVMTVRGDRQPYVDLAPLLVGYWKDVGVNVDFRVMEKSAYLNQRNNNQHDGIIEDGDGGMIDAFLFPRAYIPLHPDAAWGTGWINYQLKQGPDQEPPPPFLQRGLDLFDKMQGTADPKQQKDYFRQLLAVAKDNFMSMGIGLPIPGYGLHTARLHNVEPQEVINSWTFAYPGPSTPAQWSIKN
ncbi:MAG TPA: ABC transporter substrate-binding protein [Devosiaceae bacterium]|nr:ABC transporter substrate-binding protein [Devosiaceae bacterium]